MLKYQPLIKKDCKPDYDELADWAENNYQNEFSINVTKNDDGYIAEVNYLGIKAESKSIYDVLLELIRHIEYFKRFYKNNDIESKDPLTMEFKKRFLSL